jgi:glycosyltransferase involved in cell wall biosynthesis
MPAGEEKVVRPPPGLGIVVIGRNEGERLRVCLESVVDAARPVVYVDSGSSDGSAALARTFGAVVVELDGSTPFAPGRARNEGFRRLRELLPGLRHVQFVDGDCEIVAGWLRKAAAFLDAHPDVAVVGGQLCERDPERSVYNLLCAVEWETHAVGEAAACAGNALMRADAFAAIKGYRIDLVGGEEPELCQRLRAAGWRIWCLADRMALHDAAMTRFGQWWNRAMRSGYASLQHLEACDAFPDSRRVRRVLGVWFWALLLPVAILMLVVAWSASAAWLLMLYPLQLAKLCARGGQQGPGALRRNCWYAAFLVLAKFPRLAGQFAYLLRRCLRARPRLIDYKS